MPRPLGRRQKNFLADIGCSTHLSWLAHGYDSRMGSLREMVGIAESLTLRGLLSRDRHTTWMGRPVDRYRLTRSGLLAAIKNNASFGYMGSHTHEAWLDLIELVAIDTRILDFNDVKELALWCDDNDVAIHKVGRLNRYRGDFDRASYAPQVWSFEVEESSATAFKLAWG